MPLYNARGIVLRKYDLGESDRLLTVYTREYGKKRIVANGVRKTGSRLAGSVMLFTDSSFIIYRGKTLDRISQAETNNSFPRLREDLEAMAFASYTAELVDKFVETDEESRPLFYLLLRTLGLLAETESRELVSRTFELSLLDILGYRPHLGDCVVCGGPVHGRRFQLGVDLGGLVCEGCRSSSSQLQSLSPGSLKVLLRLQEKGFEALRVLRPSRDVLRELAAFSRRYIGYRLERPLKSLSFLDELGGT